jgi:hypothetical protein
MRAERRGGTESEAARCGRRPAAAPSGPCRRLVRGSPPSSGRLVHGHRQDRLEGRRCEVERAGDRIDWLAVAAIPEPRGDPGAHDRDRGVGHDPGPRIAVDVNAEIVEPFIGAIVAGMHEAFSLATGAAFWLGIGAVAAAFLILLPLRETVLPLERLAEIRGRSAPKASPAEGRAALA